MKTTSSLIRNVRTYLILTIMAIIAFLPTDMFAASDTDLVGTWMTSGIAPNGMMMSMTWRLNNGGTGSSSVKVGMQQRSVSFDWFLTNDNVLCFVYANGGRECGTVIAVSGATMTIASNGVTNTYARVGSQTPFGYARSDACNGRACPCKKYERKSLINSDCKNCPHSKGFHPDADK